MSWTQELAKEIRQSSDGDIIHVLNETRAELARIAAERLGKKITIKTVLVTSERRDQHDRRNP